MTTQHGQEIIENISVPLANAVWSAQFEGKTATALRQKAAEIVARMDVLASVIHMIEADAVNSVGTKMVWDGTSEKLNSASYEYVRNIPPSGVRNQRGNIDGITVDAAGEPSFTYAGSDTGVYKATSEGIQRRDQLVDHYETVRKDIAGRYERINDRLRGLPDSGDFKSGKVNIDLPISFMDSGSFTGVFTPGDFAPVMKNLEGVTMGKDSEHAGKSYIDARGDELHDNLLARPEEDKSSDEVKTETSDADPAPAAGGPGGGGGGGGVFGGGAPRMGGGFGNFATGGGGGSFGAPRTGGGFGNLGGLMNDKLDGEIDIEELLGDFAEENAANAETSGNTSSSGELPEGVHSTITDSDGNTVAYQVNEDLGGGVFLFDHATGESTPLSLTDTDNVYIDESTGQRYQMDFPITPVTASPLSSDSVIDLGSGEPVATTSEGVAASDPADPTPVEAEALSIDDYLEAKGT